jgi:tetratricopeptide (TPR) repeat protein
VRPDFAITRENAQAVALICVRLDGLPLAIELAAARSKLLPPQALLARLTSRLNLLTGGKRDLPARHQTLRAVLAWSYDLLEEGEKELLVRLSVFVGGFTLSSVEAVCGGQGLDVDVVDGVTSLMDKSLLQPQLLARSPAESGIDSIQADSDLDPRLTMLETIREYVLERLEGSTVAATIRLRHVHYFLELAETAEPELVGRHQTIWLDRLEREHDNLRAALQWSLDQGDGDISLRLSGALWRFWYTHSHLSEGRHWLAASLGHQAGVHARYVAKALHGAGVLAHYQGDNEQAIRQLDEALALWRMEQDLDELASALHDRAGVAHNQGDYALAGALYEESLRLFRSTGNTWGTAVSLYRLGSRALDLRDYVRGRELCEESYRLFHELGDKGSMAAASNSLGMVARHGGDLRRAVLLFEQALALYREVANRHGIAWSLGNLGYVALDRGDYQRARLLYQERQELVRAHGNKAGIASGWHMLSVIARAEGELPRAAYLEAQALVRLHEIGDRVTVAECLETLADLAGAQARDTALEAAPGEPYETRAARLCGAADALRAAIGAPIDMEARRPYLHTNAAIRTRLSEPRLTSAWAEGQAMSLDEAVAYAVNGTAVDAP